MVLTMNGNPSVQGPMPPPPPPPPQFPGAGPQYQRGPAHQQTPAQGSPHLQNFPAPGGAPQHGAPHGSQPNIPSHIGQIRPMEINHDGGRPIGRRQSFEGLTERLDKLNIDPTIPGKRKDPMDQDVVDLNRPAGTNGDTSVAYEGWTFYRAEPETADKKPTWERATRHPMLLSQDQLTKLVQKRKKKGQTAEEQYESLGSYRRAQVDRLIEDRKRQDGDPRFDWHYISIESKQRNVGRNGYETISMNVIVVKKPRSNASPNIISPKDTGKNIPTEVIDIHSPRTPAEDRISDFEKQPRGGNRHAQPSGAIPLGPSGGPPPLPRDVTLGPDRPMQSMPQSGQPFHQRRSGEMDPQVRVLSPHEQSPHGQEGPMRDMPRGGPQIHPRPPEVLPLSQHHPAQGNNTHGRQNHQQPQPINPQAPPHPQHFQGPERPMQGITQSGPFPQQQQHPQRGPPGMNPPEPDRRMPGMQPGPPQRHPQEHPQGLPGMNQPHAPVPPPSLPNFHGPNKNGFGPNSPIQVLNGSDQPPQRRNSHHRLNQPHQIPQLMKDVPKEHQRQKSAPKVVNLSGKSSRDKGVEKWLDESSPDEDESEIFEHEDESSATEDSYEIEEKIEKHIPGRGSLHPSRRSSRSHGRNESGYRTHRRSGHRYTGSDGHRYRYSRDSVDIIPACTNTSSALLPPPARRASVAGPVRAPPRLTYGDRVERHDPLNALTTTGFSPLRYRPREVDYGVDDRDLELDQDREFDVSYKEYMRGRMQDAHDEILLRRRAAREAEYRELKQQSELMERMERLERLRRSHREVPRYGGRRHLDYD